MGRADLYEDDFHAWAFEQATLLRAGRVTEADLANIAEEIESMGRGERRELVNRLVVLLTHLLKWQAQPERRVRSWSLTIREQRRQLRRHVKDNPSLRSYVQEAMDEAYGDALIEAQLQTDLAEEAFPSAPPWCWSELLDDDFLPD